MATDDGSDDQQIFLEPGPNQPTPANTDITGVFFRYAKNSSGERVLTANIQVKNLNKDMFTGSLSTEWRVHYNPTGTGDDEAQDRIAGARVDAQQNVTFYDDSSYLNVAPIPTEAKGVLHEGPDGVVEIVISASNSFAGSTLSRVYGETLVKNTPTDRSGLAFIVDTAPEYAADGAPTFGANFKVEPCPADEGEATPTPTPTATATATATATPTPSADPNPDPNPTPSAGPTPPPSGDTRQPANPPTTSNASGHAETTGALKLTVRRRVVRARSKRISRGRVIKFAVSTREPLTEVTAALTSQSRLVGRARLARLSRRGTLRLKLNRTVRPGIHALTVAATRTDGSRGKIAVKIVVR